MLYLQVEHLSWRSPDYGSLFISTLCDVFNEMAIHGVDVCTMLTQVKIYIYLCFSALCELSSEPSTVHSSVLYTCTSKFLPSANEVAGR